MYWFGADPGGKEAFGVAILHEDGSFATKTVNHADEAANYADEAVKRLKCEPSAAGIDAPLWWSSGQSGDRKADRFLRETFKLSSGTVQAANSLRGAVLVQGIMLAGWLRKRFPAIQITEAHPKALQKTLELSDCEIADRFGLKQDNWANEHERDALLSAVAARKGYLGHWTCDLAKTRSPSEQNPDETANSDAFRPGIPI